MNNTRITRLLCIIIDDENQTLKMCNKLNRLWSSMLVEDMVPNRNKVFLKNYGFHSNLESSQQRFMFPLKPYSLNVSNANFQHKYLELHGIFVREMQSIRC